MYNKIWRTDSKITLVPLWSSKCMKVNPYTIWIFPGLLSIYSCIRGNPLEGAIQFPLN